MVETYDLETDKKTIKICKSQEVHDKIVYYGDDNYYPNMLEGLIDSSQTATICVQALANFIATDFEDPNVGKTVVGKTITNKNYTLNKFKRDIADSLAKFNGAYIAVTKNLTNETAEVSVLDFTKVRFSEFDDLGRSNFVYVGDWNHVVEGKGGKSKFEKYPLFNTNFEVFKTQSKNCGTTTQVYHIFIDDKYIYPVNTFESVIYDMDTEKCIQESRHNEITQGSPSKLIIRTDFSKDESKKREQIEQIKRFAGPNGDKVLVIKSEFDENGNPRSNNYQVDVIPDNRDLSKYGEVEKSISNNIRKCINIPGILIDYEAATGINVSGTQLRSSVSYFNDLTAQKRRIIEEALEEIFENTAINFPSKSFKLKPFEMTYNE